MLMGTSVIITERTKSMKKKLILAALVIGMITEAAAIIYAIYLRQKIAVGGEYLILPVFALTAYIISEVLESAKKPEKPKVKGRRLTRRTPSGRAILDQSAFPEYAEECLSYEMSAFHPFKETVKRLCEYEEAYDVQK